MLQMLLQTRIAPREKQTISNQEFDDMLANTLTCAVVGERNRTHVFREVPTGHAGCILALHEVHQLPVPMIKKAICKTFPVTGPGSLTLRMALRKLGDAGTKLASKLFCERCGSCLKRLRVCARCRTVSYCSTDCQKLDWKNKHKKLCKKKGRGESSSAIESSKSAARTKVQSKEAVPHDQHLEEDDHHPSPDSNIERAASAVTSAAAAPIAWGGPDGRTNLTELFAPPSYCYTCDIYEEVTLVGMVGQCWSAGWA